MNPQTKLQWIGFCLHTVLVYVVAKLGPRLMLEFVADAIVWAIKIFRKRETKDE